MSAVSDLRGALQDSVMLREGRTAGNTLLRDEMKTGDALLKDEMKAVEKRTGERIERVYDAVKIADLTHRNAQLEKELEQYRGSQAAQESQQH